MKKIDKNRFIPDKRINSLIIELSNSIQDEYTVENFNHHADEDRYHSFLEDFVYYYSDESIIEEHLFERPFYTENMLTGIYDDGKEIDCIIPETNNLYDEMVRIHEITRLVTYLNNKANDYDVTKFVVPYYNVYDYLKRIHPFYAEYYLRKIRNDAIESAKKIKSIKETDNMAKIVAFESIMRRKDDYNIRELNKANAFSKKLYRSLNKKEYI